MKRNSFFIVLILLLSLSSKGYSQRPYGIYLPGDNCLLYSSYDMDGNWMGEYIYLRNGETELIEGKEYNKVYYENKTKTDNYSILLHMRREGKKILVRYDEYKDLLSVQGRDMTDFDKLCRYEVTTDGDLILYDFGMQEGDMFRHIEGLDDIYVVKIAKCTWNHSSTCHKDIMAVRLSNGVTLLEDLGFESFNSRLSVRFDDSVMPPVWTSPDFFDYLNEHTNRKTFLDFAIIGEERVYDAIFDGGGSSVESITFNKSQMPFDIFDLQGRRVKSQPTQKGIYIQNGRKIVVK